MGPGSRGEADVCLCERVQSGVFPVWKKERSDSKNRCLSVVSVIRLAKRKRAVHACAVLVARETCRIAVGHWSVVT